MIFVSVGTHEAPFDRMLEAIHALDLDEEVVVQHGPSSVRSGKTGVREHEFLPFDDVVANICRARAVVMHAGVGSVMISLANGKRPIVMARRHALGEHVDDHQLELARRMEASGLVTFVEDRDALVTALGGAAQPVGRMNGIPWLGDDLAEYLAEQLGSRELAATA
jgi:UDP-N-acetylglucosamine--N-acetylmuramyl-(pentapeptide) pyrophosphoryl-undecaprenol N-acetylglucosamine transferase